MTDELFDIYRQVITTLDEKVQGFHTAFKKHIQCEKGCSSCCRNAQFKIRYIEGVNLLAGYFNLPDAQKQRIAQNLRNPEESQKDDCPALVDGACALYSHRPSLCRAYGIIIQLEDKLVTCPLNFKDVTPGESLQKLDLLPYYDIVDELSERLWQHHKINFPPTEPVPEKPLSLTIRQFFERFIPLSD
jgi:Fe-S-cluster containining protein